MFWFMYTVCGGDSVLLHGCDVPQVRVVVVVFSYARESNVQTWMGISSLAYSGLRM